MAATGVVVAGAAVAGAAVAEAAVAEVAAAEAAAAAGAFAAAEAGNGTDKVAVGTSAGAESVCRPGGLGEAVSRAKAAVRALASDSSSLLSMTITRRVFLAGVDDDRIGQSQ